MRPRLLYIFTDLARNTTSSSLILHRHFEQLGDRFEVFQAAEDSTLPADDHHIELPARRLYSRLQRTRFARFTQAIESRSGCFHSTDAIRRVIRRVNPDIVLTIADGTIYIPVRTAAAAEHVPLVTMFHDWAPGWLGHLPGWARRAAERQVRRTYSASAFAFCVCKEIHQLLGPKADSAVLPPIPDPSFARHEESAGSSNFDDGFYALYAGVFGHRYGYDIKALCHCLVDAGSPQRLRIVGPEPGWTPAEMALVRRHGIYRGFVKRDVLRTALSRAPALIVICPFHPEFELCARYSFPSKIPEYCQCGRPILIWGPVYAAGVRWAKESGAAIVIDDPSPHAVRHGLEHLASSAQSRAEFAREAVRSASTEFLPSRLQEIFESGLQTALARGRAAAYHHSKS